MGLILQLRRYHYAASEESRPGEVLSVLREAFREEDHQRAFGRLRHLFEPEVLRCAVHGERDEEGEGGGIPMPSDCQEIQEGELRTMPRGNGLGGTSQGRGYLQQCSCQFDDIVRELSHEIALGEWENNAEKAEKSLFNLWQESGGARLLHEPLSALHEVWRSITDKEIGAFRRHFNQRDKNRAHRLKALGNAIVPQVAAKIMLAIKESMVQIPRM